MLFFLSCAIKKRYIAYQNDTKHLKPCFVLYINGNWKVFCPRDRRIWVWQTPRPAHLQFNSLNDYGEIFQLITFRGISISSGLKKKNCKSAESEKMDSILLSAVICLPSVCEGFGPRPPQSEGAQWSLLQRSMTATFHKEKDPYAARLLDCVRRYEKYQLTNASWLISGWFQGRRDMDDWWRREVWEITYSKKRRGKGGKWRKMSAGIGR